MVKIYTSQDNTFEGDITFENELDMNINNLVSVGTPVDSGDLANKSYVDGKSPQVITDQDVDTFTNTTTSGTENVASGSVTVSTGQKVLLMFHGYCENLDDASDCSLWFRRSSTDLNNDGYCIDTENEDSSAVWASLPMTYLDTSPGTGTVTYYVRGFLEENTNGRFTIMVVN